jgi:mono/diheme cytochrome c family protein
LPDGKLLPIGNQRDPVFPFAVTDVFHYFRNCHRSRSASTLWALIVGVTLVSASACHRGQNRAGAAQHLDFNQDVQPILASRCFACHGPDPEMRKAGLRLDLGESAMRKRPGHPDAIIPGHPEKSELIKRIESKDPHYLMPQSAQGEAKPMKPEEIATLRAWIKQGAVYRPHWAFEAPVRPSVPNENDGWAKTPIDSFVLARMEKQGLKPSPEADKETLIRRVTLDLTGLLPTPAEVRAFVNDSSPQAYEHLVDGLLARPTFGEQRARYWLDYARYADTYGLHYDNSKDIWPYRDYVIRSFNSNKPFDQFAMEQIAGDLMPAKNLDPLIGSGYVRLGLSSNEGGTITEELRVNIARERTEAFGATFMGLTVGCAVCHDHKFDPTTAKDFYALSAFFNNIDEKPFNDDRQVWAPVVRIPKTQNQDAYNRVLAKRSELAARQDSMRRHARNLVDHWLASRQNPPLPVPTEKLVLRLRLDEGSGEVLKNSAPHANPASFRTSTLRPEWGETTWLWPDFRMQSNTRVLLDQSGDYEAGQAFSSGGWFMMRSAPYFAVGDTETLISKMDAKQHFRGWDLSIRKGIVSVELVNQAPKNDPKAKDPKAKKPAEAKEPFRYPTPQDLTKKDLSDNKPPEQRKAEAKKEEEKDTTSEVAIKVATIDALPVDGRWKHIIFTYDGSGRASGVKIYINGRQAETRVASDTLAGATIRTQAPMQLGWRYPDANPAKQTRYQDVRLYARALSTDEAKRLPFEDYVAEVTAKPTSQWNEDQWHVVSEFYLNSVDPSFRQISSEIEKLNAQLEQLSEGGDLTLVSWEKPSLAYADVLTRGMYTARTERVEANTPHYLPPLPKDEPHNRLALAKWTISPQNPLTARVTVNRMWYELFGTGLVDTTEDFGIMGQRPSHPELLDWLAVEFRESGWNIKHIYKLMVMSAAYGQSAASTPAQVAKDPKNLLLSHGPRFRMDAEMLRDVALQSGGLLVSKIGGPSVKPYQPANVWEQVSYPTSDTVIYVQEHGAALYRRSMYTYWKRMASPPNMDAFDAPVRDVVCTRRQRTDTPLQALVTMNDVQWVEAARALAQRVILEAGTKPEKRIDLLSEILLSHDPPPKTAAVLEASLKQMEEHYAADKKAARALVDVGEKKRDTAIPEPELAAWTMVASEMLNLDETVTK